MNEQERVGQWVGRFGGTEEQSGVRRVDDDDERARAIQGRRRGVARRGSLHIVNQELDHLLAKSETLGAELRMFAEQYAKSNIAWRESLENGPWFMKLERLRTQNGLLQQHNDEFDKRHGTSTDAAFPVRILDEAPRVAPPSKERKKNGR